MLRLVPRRKQEKISVILNGQRLSEWYTKNTMNKYDKLDLITIITVCFTKDT